MNIADGRYRGRIENYGVMRSQAGSKHPTAFIEFSVVARHDPATGQFHPCPPMRRTYYKSVTPKTIGWLLADLKAIGFDRPGLSYFDPEAPGAANLYGREIDLDCEHEIYAGQERERWSIHREMTREKLGRDELAALDAQFGDAFRQALGGGTPTVAPAVTELNTEDDPF